MTMSGNLTAVEAELIGAAKFKPKKAYKTRQAYLLEVVRAVDKLSDDDYDSLSPEATEWQNVAISAISSKTEIPDFEDEAEDVDDVEDIDDVDDADVEDADDDDVDETEEVTASDDEPEDEALDDDDDDLDDEEPDDTGDELEDDEVDEVQEQPPARRTRLAEKAVNTPVKRAKVEKPGKVVMVETDRSANIGKPGRPPKAEKAAAKPSAERVKRAAPPFDRNSPRDRYGLIVGSNTSAAAAMFEEGTTMPEIKKRFGDNKYNLLGKLANDGHRVERFEGGRIRLTHKDDIAGTAKGGRPPKTRIREKAVGA
jgi:hypothetical protein